MARKKGQVFNAEIKTKIVLELFKGEVTINELASQHNITVKSIQNWKKHFLENAFLAFNAAGATKTYKYELKDLKAENEQLARDLHKATVRADFAEGKLKSLDLSNKKALIDPQHKVITISEQCEILNINRSSYYYESVQCSKQDKKIIDKIYEIHTNQLCYGYRRIHKQLIECGFEIGVNKVLKYMNSLGIHPIFPKKKKLTTFEKHKHKSYPYLLKNIEINRPNQVWSGDIVKIKNLKNPVIYLAAIMDLHTRTILSWKISNSIDTSLTTNVLKEAIDKYGTPEIVNTDNKSQYTSYDHRNILDQHNIKISMNLKRRPINNITIDRFFKRLPFLELLVKDYKDMNEVKKYLSDHINDYNAKEFNSKSNLKSFKY